MCLKLKATMPNIRRHVDWSNLPADTSCIGTSSVDANEVHQDGNLDATDGKVLQWVVEEPPKDWLVDFRCSSHRHLDTARHLQSFIDSRLNRESIDLSDVCSRWTEMYRTIHRKHRCLRFNYSRLFPFRDLLWIRSALLDWKVTR